MALDCLTQLGKVATSGASLLLASGAVDAKKQEAAEKADVLEGKIAELEQNKQELEALIGESVADAEAKIEAAQAKLDEAISKLDSAETGLEEARANLEGAKEHEASVKSDRDNAEDQLEEIWSEFGDLVAQLLEPGLTPAEEADLEQQLAAKSDDGAAQQLELDELNENLDKAKKDVKKKAEKVASSEEKLEEAESKFEEAQAKFEEAEAKLEEKLAKINDKESEVSSKEAEVANELGELHAIDLEVSALLDGYDQALNEHTKAKNDFHTHCLPSSP